MKPILVEIRSVFSRERGLRYEVRRWQGATPNAYSIPICECRSYNSAKARATREVNRINRMERAR